MPKIDKKEAQILPIVLILGAILSLMASTLVVLFRHETRQLIKHTCVTDKAELASIALEHVLYKLQHGANWDTIPLEGFNGYDKEYTCPIGKYAIHISKGNYFQGDLSTTKQGQIYYRTLGIKVKSNSGNCTGAFSAVIKRVSFGGPIVSKGKIDFPCTSGNLEEFESYWGDIYCGNTNTGYCRIPKVPIGNGNHHPQDWKPQVYSKADIYTLQYATGRSDVYFGSTYTDMSPTAHCHPFSPYADVPEIDLDYFKDRAKINDAYYGPQYIGGTGQTNPYYIGTNRETYPSNDVVALDGDGQNTLIDTLFGHMTTIDPPSVLFIDTTDALPLRPNGAACNSYAVTSGGVRHIDVQSNDGTDGTLRWYKNEDEEKYSRGFLFVQGPLMIVGNDPDSDGDSSPDFGDAASVQTGVPDNYYFPRREDNEAFNYDSGTPANSYLGNVKHNGFIYVGGELQLGGHGATDDRGTWTNGSVTSYIVIYGSVYIGPYGSITTWSPGLLTDNEVHIYYNPAINIFGFTGNSVTVLTFNEISFLIPTPVPAYPSSF